MEVTASAMKLKNLRNYLIVCSLAVSLVLAGILPAYAQNAFPHRTYSLDKIDLSLILSLRTPQIKAGVPLKVDHPLYGKLEIHNTLDPEIQKRAEELLTKRWLRGAAVVALDAATGRVLALAGVKNGRLSPMTTLTAEAPAASLFKVITAAAAVEEIGLKPGQQAEIHRKGAYSLPLAGAEEAPLPAPPGNPKKQFRTFQQSGLCPPGHSSFGQGYPDQLRPGFGIWTQAAIRTARWHEPPGGAHNRVRNRRSCPAVSTAITP
jgi:hypothetical protein